MTNKKKNFISIDFAPYSTIQRVIDVYNYLLKFERKKANLIAKAYAVYNKEKGVEKNARQIISSVYKFKLIANIYNINDENKEEQLRILLESKAKEEKPKVVKPAKMSLVFDDTEEGQAAYSFFEPLKTKERIFSLVDIIEMYWDSGEDKEYTMYQSEELLQSLSRIYEGSKTDKTLNDILKMLIIPIKMSYVPLFVEPEDLKEDLASSLERLK